VEDRLHIPNGLYSGCTREIGADGQPRASTRLSAGKPRRLDARSEASADDARDRVAREAAVAARHTVWTPAHEQALLAALASTPECAEDRRLPDSR
jgi:hypothetical protein